MSNLTWKRECQMTLSIWHFSWSYFICHFFFLTCHVIFDIIGWRWTIKIYVWEDLKYKRSEITKSRGAKHLEELHLCATKSTTHVDGAAHHYQGRLNLWPVQWSVKFFCLEYVFCVHTSRTYIFGIRFGLCKDKLSCSFCSNYIV